jgi:hypothetical protein
VRSNTESSLSDNVSIAGDVCPLGDTAVATPLSLYTENPGRLSTVCAPGIKRIVVFSTSSLLFPL